MSNKYVLLIKDNKNQYDANAFQVHANDGNAMIHVGYIQRHSALELVEFFEYNNIKLKHQQCIICTPYAKLNEWFVIPYMFTERVFDYDMTNRLIKSNKEE